MPKTKAEPRTRYTSLFRFRRAADAELDSYLPMFYEPQYDKGPFADEHEALEYAFAEWEAEEFQVPFFIQWTPGQEGEASEFHVWYLEDVTRDQAHESEQPIYVKEFEDGPWGAMDEKMAGTVQRQTWRKGFGRQAYLLQKEALTRPQYLERRQQVRIRHLRATGTTAARGRRPSE
jgi:hypothetical protein